MIRPLKCWNNHGLVHQEPHFAWPRNLKTSISSASRSTWVVAIWRRTARATTWLGWELQGYPYDYQWWLWKPPIFWGILPFRHGGLILGCLSLFGMICLASCFSWDVFFCGASLNIRMVLTWPMLLAGLGYHQSSGAWLCGLRQHLVVQPCYLDKIGASPDGTTSETSLDWLVRRGLKHPETGEEIALKGCIDAGSVAPKDRSWNLWLTGSKPPFPPATTLWWSLPRGCFSVNRPV